jgi:hypothetical protein
MRFTLIALLVAVVTLHAGDLAGHYVLRGEREVGSEMLLKPDGSFEYMLAYGAADYWAKGTWREDKGSVVLRSEGGKQAPFRFLRSSTSEADGVRVWLKAPDGQPVEHIDVALKTAAGWSTRKTNEAGAAVFRNAQHPSAVSFRVAVYDLQAGPFEVEPGHNEFYFEIDGNAITRVHFEEERLAIEGTGLILRYWDKDHPMRYEKQ